MIWLLIGCVATDKKTSEDTAAADLAACIPSADLFNPFPLIDADVRTQIHADVAAVEDELWLVYNLPDEQGLFKTHIKALDCTGQQIFAAQRLSDSSSNFDEGAAKSRVF